MRHILYSANRVIKTISRMIMLQLIVILPVDNLAISEPELRPVFKENFERLPDILQERNKKYWFKYHILCTIEYT